MQRQAITTRRLTAASVVAILVTLAFGVGSAAAAPAQSFANCDEARAAGFSDIPRGGPGYAPHLDRNGDGIACESGAAAQTPATAPPATEAPAADVSAPGTEVRGVTVDAAPGELAETGVTSWILAVLGLALLSAGRRTVATADRHRRRSSLRRTRTAQVPSRSWAPTAAPLPELPALTERDATSTERD